jgi:hypothetical protein
MFNLISSLLLTIILFILFGGGAFLIYQIPLIFTFSGTWGEHTVAGYANIRWGLGNVRIIPTNGKTQLEILILKKRMISWSLPDRRSYGIPVQNDFEQAGQTKAESDTQKLLTFLPYIKKLILLFFSHIRMEPVTGTIKFGAGDPVTTGMVYGYYQAASLLCMGVCSAVMIPVFDRLILEGDLRGGVRIMHPAGFLIRSIRIILPEFFPASKNRDPGQKNMGGTSV